MDPHLLVQVYGPSVLGINYSDNSVPICLSVALAILWKTETFQSNQKNVSAVRTVAKNYRKEYKLWQFEIFCEINKRYFLQITPRASMGVVAPFCCLR